MPKKVTIVLINIAVATPISIIPPINGRVRLMTMQTIKGILNTKVNANAGISALQPGPPSTIKIAEINISIIPAIPVMNPARRSHFLRVFDVVAIL